MEREDTLAEGLDHIEEERVYDTTLITESSPDEQMAGAGARPKTMTEKGRIYTMENKEKRLKNVCRQMNRKSTHIEKLMADDNNGPSIQQVFSEWLPLYEEYLMVRSSQKTLIAATDIDTFCEIDATLSTFKSDVERWFLNKASEPIPQPDVQPNDSVSQTGSNNTNSAVTLARLREEQHRVEVELKTRALQKRRRLQLARLELQLEEEQFELDTELAISQAKTEIIDNFEYFDKSNLNALNQNQTNAPVIPSHAAQNLPSHAAQNLPSHSAHNSPSHSAHNSPSHSAQNLPSHSAYNSPSHFAHTTQAHFAPEIVHDCQQNISNNFQVPVPDNHNEVASVVRQLRKPVPEIHKFTGDPLQYGRFMRQFRSRIVVNTENDEERMEYLEQYTGGEACKIVRCFDCLEPTIGYKKALKELEDRYGNKEVIANAFVKQALDWPVLKSDNCKALDDYAIFLTECENAVMSIEAVRILEYPDNLKKLVTKLPYYYHDKWRSIVLQHRTKCEEIKFSYFAKFVKTEAKKANDPTYGRDALRVDVKAKTQRPTIRSKATFSTKVTSPQSEETAPKSYMVESINTNDNKKTYRTAFSLPCLYCNNNNHCLEKCESLRVSPYDDKLSFLKSKRLCFGCLKFGHMSKQCKYKATCQHCQKRHPSICHNDDYSQQYAAPYVNQNLTSATANLMVNSTDDTRAGDCTMAIIPVSVKMSNGISTIQTYAFLDPGSSSSFCTESLLKKIGGSGKPMKITLDTMGTPHTMKTYIVQGLQVGNLNMDTWLKLPKVYTKDHLPVSTSHIPTSADIKHWPHLKGIHLPVINADIGLLIGNDIPDAYSPLITKTGPSGSPHATKSRLGWITWNVIRPSSNAEQRITVNRTTVVAIEEAETLKQLDIQLQKGNQLDFPEHIIDDKLESSQEDKRFLEKIDSSITLIDGHYTINLPFKRDDVTFPNNEIQARLRLKGIKSKMASNPKFREDYKLFMANILEKNYAEAVPPNDRNRDDGKVWYLPHHGVYHPKKPEKIRVVFDCAAQYLGVSLNNELLHGPDLTNSLLAVLLRFRQEKVAVMSDIESMFYQVRVPQEDRDYLRFLWWPDGDTQRDPVAYRMNVHLFGATSSPSCSNAALRRTADCNKDQFSPGISEVVHRSFYVDDCVTSVESEDTAIKLVEELTMLCQLGGFHLTKWTSNRREVLLSVKEEERTKGIRQIDLKSDLLPSERALGMHWSTEKDKFGFDIKVKQRPNTKRGILSVVSSIYDPLGFVAPFILNGRNILQEICRQRLGWDEEVPCDVLSRWERWMSELPHLENFEIERCYKPGYFSNTKECQLHVFSDASNTGYGVCMYLRLTDDNGQIHGILLMGKSRVSPLKKISIPRMELTAATVAVRLGKTVQRHLDYAIDSIHYWTDSMCVLRYISNESSRFHTFVANRIAVIRDGSEPSQWHYVESKINPADCASRGQNIDKFLDNTEWKQGPAFLQLQESEWPHRYEEFELLDEDPEIRKLSSNATVSKPNSNDCVYDLVSRHSDWLSLRRVLGWVLLAVETFKKRKLKKPSCSIPLKELLLNEEFTTRAEVLLVQHAQQQHFAEEISQLTEKENLRRKTLKSSPLKRLDPFISDGVLRVGGRLSRAAIPFNARHPVILPKDSKVTQLYLEHIHKRVGHMGKNSMLTTLRQKCWVLGASTAIKRLVSKCVSCRKYRARVEEQKMADLPTDRVTPTKVPFSAVGMDYFGPIEIRRGRSNLKRYGVIFTCLTTRAVHLEVANSLDTDSCINAIRRFISRRGPVDVIRSDNGTNLVGSERELREQLQKWNQSKIHKILQQKNVSWIFNPPAASHHGGVWERMIRMTRKVFHSVLKEQPGRLDDELLATFFCEVESILNGRPITEPSSDCQDLEALTPNHLLLMRSGEVLPPGIFEKSDNYATRRWKQIQYLADLFWKRWTREYLLLLQERQKWLYPRRNIQINDIVLIVDNSPRSSWSLGKVMEVTKDRKGFVRSAKIRTKSSLLVRPIDKLCLILEADIAASQSEN